MSASKLAVLLCVAMACGAQALAQVVWTEPADPAAGEQPAADPYAGPAALFEQVKLSNPVLNTFGMGAAVAIDGDTAVVGAPDGSTLNGIHRGAVFVYTRASGSWQFEQALPSSYGGYFGQSVDISGDTLITSRQFLNTEGDAQVFVRTGDTWTSQATLEPSRASGAVAIDGDTALIAGFGEVYAYVRSGSTWTQQGTLVAPDQAPDRFGQSGPQSIALDGDTAIVGGAWSGATSNDGKRGAVYVFTRSGVTWSPQAKLISSAGTANRWFGSEVALSGNTVLVSGGGLGAYEFERTGATWAERPGPQMPVPPPICPACPSIRVVVGGVAIDGNTAIVPGAPGAGGNPSYAGAYWFTRLGTSWFLQEILTPSDGYLGPAAVVGNTVLVGAPNLGRAAPYEPGPGAAYLFTLPDTLPNQPPGAPTLTASVSGTTVNLSWTPEAGSSVLSFVVEAGTASGLSNIFNGNVGTTRQLSAVAPPGNYYLRVRGVNAHGAGPASLERLVSIGAPSAPTVTSTTESGGILTVTWSPGPGDSATAHRLDFYAGNTLVGSLGAGATTAIGIPVPAGIRGSFGVRVTALNGAIASPASALYAFTLGPPCTPPASPSLSGGIAGGTASVTWTAVADATQYVLSAGTTQGGTQFMPPTDLGTNTSVSAGGLPAGFTAWVRVVAVNACGQQSAPADVFLQ